MPFRRPLAAHWPLWAVCALFLLVAALALDDYGIWVDTCLAGDGERAFDQLPTPHSHYYGAAFETPLALLERVLGLEDPGSISRSRNFLTHLFFLAGGVFCYLLVLRMFGSRPLALVALALFLLHPRIYAHSFFNSKDAPFVAMFMIALYLVHRAFRRDTLGAFLLCGVGVGLLVNLRIVGVLLFAAVLIPRALDLAFAGSADGRKRILLTGGTFALAAVLAYHASMPALWTDPFGRFAELTRMLGDHPYESFNLFRGDWLYSRDGPPWDYAPVWLGIATPPATLLLAFIGTVALAWRGLRRPRDVLRNGPLRFGFLLALLPVAAVVAVVVLETNVYNTWRQLFFLYAPLAPLAVFGFRWLISATHGRWAGAGAYALMGVAVAAVLIPMVRIHPHQNNYFNALTDRTTPERLQSRYEMPGWQQAPVLETLTAIVGAHPSGPASLALSEYASIHLRLFLEELEQFRLTRDFRSGERNALILPDPEACSLASAPPSAIVHADRIYANTLHCVVDPVAWFGERRRAALASGSPLVRSVYDIYRDGRLLTWVRDECPREDVEGGGTRFFLHVVPVDAGDIPPWRGGHNFDNLDRFLREGSARIDGNCVAVVLLPDYPIVSIRTGQFTDDGILWEAGIAIGDGAPDYAVARREALAGEPLARSVFDVHRAGRALTYLRDGCTEAEATARFFLHVVPVDEDDLPEHRREHGFDNLDFTLAARGARPDGNCVAVVGLPDYPIATVRTGQYDDAGALWTAEFALPDGE